MEQATGQAIPLQQTGVADLHGVDDGEEVQCRQELPLSFWLQTSFQEHFAKPKTRKGQILCWSFWLVGLAAGCVLFWQVLPRFVDYGEHFEHVDTVVLAAHTQVR